LSAPEHLSPAARLVWDQVVAGYDAGYGDPVRVARIEGPDLEAYCVQVARMRDAQARIDAEGLVVPDEKGRPVPHPAIAIEKQAQAEVRAWGGRFRPRAASREVNP
jgi:P27 family predicted phage terminase small subunit